LIKTRALIFTAAFLLALAGTAYSQTSTTGRPTDAEWQLILDRVNLLVDNHFENRDYSEEQKTNWNITGLSVGIYKNGRTAFFNRGYHESEQRRVANRRPVTENSIFAIGSTSKPISSIMLSYFSRDNPATGRPLVNLNDSINDYFETNPFIDTDGTKIYPTLLQLASHYSGGSHGGSSYTLDQFKSMLKNFTYSHKPGTVYKYASGSTIAANVVASEYYGNEFPEKRVNDLLQEFLFVPLGMNSTKLHGWLDPALRDRMVLSHRFNGAPGSFRSVPTRGINLGGPSGCITSTAVDMMRLAAFIMGDGVPVGAEVLQQAAAAGIGWNRVNRSVPSTALTPHESNASKMGAQFRELLRRPANSGQRYGRTLNHGGRIEGYHESYMRMCPDTKTAVIVLVNNAPSERGPLSAQIMDRVLNATYSGQRTAFDDFDDRVASYSGANTNIDIALTQDLTIEAPINHIRAPARAGATLTIRSANPARPVTLTRGTSGDLFTVPNGVTLIFKDIIIDGGGNILFSAEDDDDDDDDEEGEGAVAVAVANTNVDEEGNPLTKPATVVAGTLVRVNAGGTFIMESSAVLRNNINSGNGGSVFVNTNGTFTMNSGEIINNTGKDGGGVYVARGGKFTMNAGEISGNTASSGGGVMLYNGAFTLNGGKITGNTAINTGGGVRAPLANSVFTMTGGEISGNTAGTHGGGLRLSDRATFNMTGGIIIGNTSAGNGNGVAIATTGTTFNLNGGVVAGVGRNIAAVISGTHHLNKAAPSNAVIIAWNRPTGALNYITGSNTHLTLSSGATATWLNQDSSLGISYTNGANTGWIKVW